MEKGSTSLVTKEIKFILQVRLHAQQNGCDPKEPLVRV